MPTDRPARRLSFLALPALIAAALCACSSGSPTRPSPVDPLLGTWVGSVTETIAGGGQGTLRLTFTERDIAGNATGTWEWAFPNAALNNRGSVETFQNQGFFFLLETPYDCVIRPIPAFAATVTLDGNRLRASFTSIQPCLGGTFDLRRQ